MGRNSFWGARVKCPFYRDMDDRKLCCEGITDRGSVILRFSSVKHIKKDMNAYCADLEKCKDCFIHKALMERWDKLQGDEQNF